jgi:RNA polymerase sigma-70 factor, ECF subfamily
VAILKHFRQVFTSVLSARGCKLSLIGPAQIWSAASEKEVMLTEGSQFSELRRDKPKSFSRIGLPLDDDGLIGRLKAHDERAFETMVRRYGPRMFATTRRLLGNEHDARDAVQQAFISAFRSINGFNAHAKLSTWLHRIAVNAALMQLRCRRRRPELPIEDLLPQFDDAGRWMGETEQTGSVVEHPVQRRETCQMVRHCIDQLPETLRSVLILRDIEELDTAKVAQMLSISPNATKIRVHRARLALKSLIEREHSET